MQTEEPGGGVGASLAHSAAERDRALLLGVDVPGVLRACLRVLAESARRSVCGMLVRAQLSKTWSHHRAHRFFSHASWSIEAAASAVAARLVVRLS